MLGLKKEKYEDCNYHKISIVEPLESLPSKPEWTKSFISNEQNNVYIDESIEIKWGEMIE